MERTMRKALFTALAILGIALGGVVAPTLAHAAPQNNEVAGQDGNAA
jgi:esterase/lipase